MAKPKPLENKIIVDVARGLATLFLSLAAIFLGLAAFVDKQEFGQHLQVIFLSLTSLHILLAARIIDWILDKIPPELWASVSDVDKDIALEKFTVMFFKWEGLYFRLRMFGGAYAAFVAIITVIAAAAFYVSIYRAQQLDLLPSISGMTGADTSLKFFVCLFITAYIPYQMMTINAKGHKFLFAAGVFITGIA